MGRGALYSKEVKVQFSGHETFPLRYSWLKKAFDAVSAAECDTSDGNKWVFGRDDAIARFGVGKNMVVSMRHWALAAGVIDEERPFVGPLRCTTLGRRWLADDGYDPYLEDPASLWLLHWQFAGSPDRTTTWYWAFNHFAGQSFDRDQLAEGLLRLCDELQVPRVAPATIKRDVECFVRTYVARPPTENALHEDNLESPLTELSLVQPIGRRDGFQFRRGPKPTLPDGVFLYALWHFWRSSTTARTLSVEAVSHEPGSPGRIFQLDEESLMERLTRVEDATGGGIVWSETAGLRQLICNAEPEEVNATVFLDSAFQSRRRATEAA